MAEEHEEAPTSPDVHFEPLVKLPLVDIRTLEEDEEELFKMRAKLFRYDTNEDPAEWKERGTGEVKLLKHNVEGSVRILMRRDKTLKVCANHYIQPYMELKPNNTSDRAWIWNTLADFADEEPKPELLAIKFANAENAQKFKVAFEEAKKLVIKTLGSEEEEEEEEEEEKEDNASEDKMAESNDTSKQADKPAKQSEADVAAKQGEGDVATKQNEADVAAKQNEADVAAKQNEDDVAVKQNDAAKQDSIAKDVAEQFSELSVKESGLEEARSLKTDSHSASPPKEVKE